MYSTESKEKEKEASHRSIALRVIGLIGNENLIWALGKIWRWNGHGLWEQIEDRVIKKMIHESMDDRKITKFSIESVLDITKTEIYMTNHQFDVDTRAINCLNGELHFKDGAWHLKPHDKRHFRTTQIPIVYNPEASAPRFEQF
jgi:putative DNA primase/helicase